MLFVAGGVGAAPVYPQVKWLHEHGIEADVIVGSKTKDMLILEDEMKAVAGNYYPCRFFHRFFLIVSKTHFLKIRCTYLRILFSYRYFF